MASIHKRGRKFLVRWRDPDGGQRTRSCPDHETAKRLQREVERSASLGARWEPPDARAFPALFEVKRDAQGQAVRNEDGNPIAGGLFTEFLERRRARLAPGTYRHYDRALLRFVAWLAAGHPHRRRLTVDMLTRDALEGWFAELVDDRLPTFQDARARLTERNTWRRAEHDAAVRAGRKVEPFEREELRPEEYRVAIATARLYITAVWEAWSWGFDSDDYGDHVGRPRHVDLPSPTNVPAAAPTWAEMDACIGAAYSLAAAQPKDQPKKAQAWLWRARLYTFLRFTGLRVDLQAMHIRWSDLDLDNQRLTLRGELGKSKRERQGREIPLSPHLCKLIAGWGKRDGGFLIAPDLTYRASIAQRTAIAWELAVVGRDTDKAHAVNERVWAPPHGRHKGQPHHAFRKGYKTGLSELGVAQEVRDYLLGHNRGIDEHYLDTYRQAQAAVAKIPALSTDAEAAPFAEVVNFPRGGR